MLRTLTTLLRGAAADADEAVFDANAILILKQQLRDAAIALEHSKRELACTIAHQSAEERALEALAQRISLLEDGARQALTAGREDLAHEAAVVIAANEDESAERRAALDRYSIEVRRLKQLAESGRSRLMDLRRGLELARAQDALHRAGANGRRALASGSSALHEAETTLTKIRELQTRAEDVATAIDDLDRQGKADDVQNRLAAAGFGAKGRSNPADVLARLKTGAAYSQQNLATGGRETAP